MLGRGLKFAAAAGFVATVAPQSEAKQTTPNYLKPYWMKSQNARFGFYASTEIKGTKHMRPADFLASMTMQQKRDDNAQMNEIANQRLLELFQQVDSDSDGLLSYKEYCFFVTLLTATENELRLALNMYDINGNGQIGIQQFKSVMSALRADASVRFDFQGTPPSTPPSTPPAALPAVYPYCLAALRGGITYAMFADSKGNTTKKIKANDILALREKLATELWTIEFLQFDNSVATQKLLQSKKPDMSKCQIPLSDVASVLYSTMGLGNHLPIWVVQRMQQCDPCPPASASRDALEAGKKKVSLKTWLDLNRILTSSSDLPLALSLFTAGGSEIRADDLARAVKVVQGFQPSKEVINIVFQLFDKDQDGTLSHDELIDVLETRQRANTSGALLATSQKHLGFVPAFVQCLNESWSNAKTAQKNDE
eukprot:gene2256-3127_t